MYTHGTAKLLGKLCLICIVISAIAGIIGIMFIFLGIIENNMFGIGLWIFISGIAFLPLALFFNIIAEVLEKLHLNAEYSKQIISNQEKLLKTEFNTNRIMQQILDISKNSID